MHIVLGVSESDASLNAFNWIKHNPLYLWKDLKLTLVHVATKHDSGVALLRKFESLAKDFAKSVSTKLLSRQKSVGRSLKEFVATLQQPLLVLGCSGQKWKVIDYCAQRCFCPVMVVKRDYFYPSQTRPTVGLAMDVNVHCDRTFSWFLKNADLPDSSQLYVIHITPKRTDKPDARRFLASLKPKCLESKKMYSMASALVSYDKGGVAEGLIRFCRDKRVGTLVVSSKGDGQLARLRLSNSVMNNCLRHAEQDVLIWMDEQTRNVSASPYILNFQGETPAPVKVAPWDGRGKANFIDEINVKAEASKKNDSESETKAKKNPHPPSYPRPKESPLRPNEMVAPLAPIADSYTQPISDPSRSSRRKNSLKYYMYDQIAKGKNQLSRFKETPNSDWNYVEEPLSP